MQQRGRRGRPVKGPSANRPKARKVPTEAPSIANLQEQVGALTRELKEANERQTAAAEVLQIINSSQGDLAPVFEGILQRAIHLCEAAFGNLWLYDGESFELVAAQGPFPPTYLDMLSGAGRNAGPKTAMRRAVLTRETVQIADYQLEQAYLDRDPVAVATAEVGMARTILAVPMIGEAKTFGVFFVYRQEVRDFSERQIAFLQNFAAQAVIAMENARLLGELRGRTQDLEESLKYQTATSDVLKVISRSAFDLDAVLNTLVQSAVTLSGAPTGTIFQKRGGLYHLTAQYGYTPEMLAYGRANPIAPDMGSNVGRTAMTGAVVEIPDVLADPDFSAHGYQRVGNYRAMLGIPLKRDGKVEGVFSLAKPEPGPFEPRHVELVQTFADQAVIAIENTRLFEEVHAKTRDLEESLQQQTATAEVLKVISRSTFDLPAVLHALVETAARLCNADKGTITRQKDGVFYRAESFGFSEDFMNYVRGVPVVVDRHSATGRALFDGVVVHIPDVEADRDYTFREGQRLGDFRALLGVPMLREGVPIGVITLTRTEPEEFTDKQIELAITFADQAAIAIENVRLFDEVQERTRELSQSLDDLRKAQDRLIQTEKLASLGQLTAGIAHEIKNPLNFVNNFSALSIELTDELNELLGQAELATKLRQDVGELTTLLKDNLAKIVQHGKRADSIVKNMLLHSREGSREQQRADINALVNESLNLAYHGARAEKSGVEITLQRNFDANAGTIDLFPQEISRALINLISNGFYAANRRKADSVGAGFEPTVSATTQNLGSSVEIRIRDNGTGIPPEVREKMFNPFFTTKPTGEGTGLGLSMTHDIIVKQHGGRIDVETEVGAFTEFIIILPRDNRAGAGQKLE